MDGVRSLRVAMTDIPPAWRRAASALSVLWTATALGAGATFLAQALLARELGPAGFGHLTGALATVTMLAPFAGFGLPQLWLRLYGAEGWSARRWMTPSLRFVGATAGLCCAGIVAWACTGAPQGTPMLLMLLLPIVPCTLVAGLVSTKLRLEEDDWRLAAWQLALPACRLLFVAMLIPLAGVTATQAAMGYGCVAVGITLGGLPHLWRMHRGDFALRGHTVREEADLRPPTVSMVWRLGWAYGLVALLYPVFFQIGTVLLAAMDQPSDAGIFGIGLGVMTAVYLLPATVYQKYLASKLHRWAVHDPAAFRRAYRQGNRWMFVAGVACGLLVAGTAPWFVPVAFGHRYAAAIPVLELLSLCVPLRFASVAIAAALLDERQARLRVAMMATSAVVVLLLDLILIPRHHALGAALATVVGEVVLLAASWLAVRHSATVISEVRP